MSQVNRTHVREMQIRVIINATESLPGFVCFRFTCQHVAERSSPLSLKVIFEQVKRGGGISLQENLDHEFSINTHLFGLPDFEMAMQAREAGVSLKTGNKCELNSSTMFLLLRIIFHDGVQNPLRMNLHVSNLGVLCVCQGGTPAWKCGSMENVSGDQVAAVFDKVPRSK